MDMEKMANGQGETEGEDQDHELDCALKAYLEAKELEADPERFAQLKAYAQAKGAAIAAAFGAPKKVKSMKDLKSAYADKVAADEGVDPE